MEENKTKEKAQEIENKKKNNRVVNVLIILCSLIVILIGVIMKVNDVFKNKKINIVTDKNYHNCNNNVNFEPGIIVDAKPIIYLYPKSETEVTVKLGKEENLTCTYPKYKTEGWKVLAKPNGDLVDLKTGRNLYSLYWEGINTKKYNEKLEEGFVVKGEDTISFLEEKLEILGLSQTEAKEFIVYWLPQMENNKYNYIRFQTKEEIEENMPLEINPKPDTIIRVMMEWKELEKYEEVKEQKLIAPERKGFVAVEWGGTEIVNN